MKLRRCSTIKAHRTLFCACSVAQVLRQFTAPAVLLLLQCLSFVAKVHSRYLVAVKRKRVSIADVQSATVLPNGITHTVWLHAPVHAGIGGYIGRVLRPEGAVGCCSRQLHMRKVFANSCDLCVLCSRQQREFGSRIETCFVRSKL